MYPAFVSMGSNTFVQMTRLPIRRKDQVGHGIKNWVRGHGGDC